MENKTYMAIDLKSFYASVECIERGLDPLRTNLVVADNSRTDKTICLALTPSLKLYGVKARPRLFEVIQKVKEINARRLNKLGGKKFSGSSYDIIKLNETESLSLDYIVAPPRMAYYIEYSTKIYNLYLKYIAPEDIHVYSIDEVFIDATNYLKTYNLSAYELCSKILLDILKTTGITATAGIASNLYLAKVAMDILAKHISIQEDGMQIAQLDEMSYRQLLWSHKPITDFWRVGKGYAKRLEEHGLYTMGDIARCSIGKSNEYYNEDLLYKLFGINAELLIDHAWGWEPCSIQDIKAYKPTDKSIGSGQVLHSPYTFEKGKLIAWEMADLLVLDLVDKKLVTKQIGLTIGYDRENLSNMEISKAYKGQIKKDSYGRLVPKPAHAKKSLVKYTSSTKEIVDATMELFEEIVDKNLLIRKINISLNYLVEETSIKEEDEYEQLSLFTDYNKRNEEEKKEKEVLLRERKFQETILELKKRYGKNAIIKGVNLEEGATTLERNKQIGGHKA